MAGICRKELLYALVLMLGALTFGYVMGYPALALLSMEEQMGIDHESTQATFFNSVTSLAAIAGPFITALLLRFMGRKPATCIIAIFGVFSWSLLLALKPSIFWFGILVRALLGLTIGAFSSIIPMYIVELAPPSSTGFYGSLNQLAIATGIVIVYFVGNFLDWKKTAIIGIIIPACLAGLVWLIPESPAVVYSSIPRADESREKPSIFQRKYLHPLFVCVMMMVFQQFCGINAILTNIGALFANIGVSIDIGIASAISAIAQVISVFIGAILIDKFGRKVCWTLSFSGMVIALALYAASLKTSMPNWMPICIVFFYLLSFGLGAGPIPWFIVAEMFESSVRPIASSIVSSSNWLMAFTLISAFPKMVKAMTEFYCFIFFMLVSILGTIFGLLFIKNPSAESLTQSPLLNDGIEYVD
ncbi:major facilitator superfamily transporter [Tritrichomonas foetus]|uniref:Major facilitator superfamily transporter n=1 Tax=Tritrichomonas foetus TaxID=1144522 RepID=A0A1J4KER4_9EUKA|nr:major facilitator superfamily transporter [Tritrichomonas foetus]|eukprot:OHT09945.1 major facilitator superfamily transporter [Tritrichomonas foetus]